MDSIRHAPFYANSADPHLSAFMLAVFKLLLYRYSGEEDVIVGATVSARVRPELRSVVGELSVSSLFFLQVMFCVGKFSWAHLSSLSFWVLYVYLCLFQKLCMKRTCSLIFFP